MAVSTTTKTDWIDGNNDVIVSILPVRIKAIEVQGNPAATTDCYVRIWNSVNATPGTTEPDEVLYVPRPNVKDGKVKQKTILGGKRLDTGLTMGVYTTPFSGSTSVVAAAAPLSVKIFYDPA